MSKNNFWWPPPCIKNTYYIVENQFFHQCNQAFVDVWCRTKYRRTNEIKASTMIKCRSSILIHATSQQPIKKQSRLNSSDGSEYSLLAYSRVLALFFATRYSHFWNCRVLANTRYSQQYSRVLASRKNLGNMSQKAIKCSLKLPFSCSYYWDISADSILLIPTWILGHFIVK